MPIDHRRCLCVYEVLSLLQRTGWPRDAWATAAATFRHESWWDPQATSPPNRDGTYDRGLVQLNSRYHPDDALAFDPLRSVAKALELYRDRGFRPWYAWVDGHYRKWMPECEAAVAAQTLPYPGQSISLGAAGIPPRTVSYVLRRRGWTGCPLSSVYTSTVRDVVKAFQREKTREGCDTGGIDGIVGPRTWRALFECRVT